VDQFSFLKKGQNNGNFQKESKGEKKEETRPHSKWSTIKCRPPPRQPPFMRKTQKEPKGEKREEKVLMRKNCNRVIHYSRHLGSPEISKKGKEPGGTMEWLHYRTSLESIGQGGQTKIRGRNKNSPKTWKKSPLKDEFPPVNVIGSPQIYYFQTTVTESRKVISNKLNNTGV